MRIVWFLEGKKLGEEKLEKEEESLLEHILTMFSTLLVMFWNHPYVSHIP